MAGDDDFDDGGGGDHGDDAGGDDSGDDARSHTATSGAEARGTSGELAYVEYFPPGEYPN